MPSCDGCDEEDLDRLPRSQTPAADLHVEIGDRLERVGDRAADEMGWRDAMSVRAGELNERQHGPRVDVEVPLAADLVAAMASAKAAYLSSI